MLAEWNITDATAEDLGAVLAINQGALPHVSVLTPPSLEALTGWARHFRVARVAGEVAGFLLALGPEQPYASLNYRWFSARYPAFVYIDRVAVAPAHHRRGLGAALYADLFGSVGEEDGVIACEVNERPRNDASLAFHERLGFEPVGRQETEGGAKTVRMMIKRV